MMFGSFAGSRRRTLPFCCAVIALVIWLVSAAAAHALPPRPTQADAKHGRVTWTNTGKTGSVGIPATVGIRTFAYGGEVMMPQRRVCATAGYGGSQTVTITFRSYKWLNGGWKLYGYNPNNFAWQPTYTRSYRVAPGTCVWAGAPVPRFGAPQVLFEVIATSADLAGGSTGGYFSSDLTVRWNKYSNGEFLGRQYIDYDAYDYQCFSEVAALCITGKGWVYMYGFNP